MDIKRHFLVYKGLPRDMYILFASSVINRMGSFIVPLMTLILTEKIGFSKSEAGLFSSVSMLSQGPFILLGGFLADKFGSKKTIVIFDALGALVYMICGFLKPDLAVAVLIIIASSLYAIAVPAFTTIVAEVTPSSGVKSAYSLMYLGYNLGLTVGPILGGLLFSSYLNLLFIFDALTTFLATLLIQFMVDDKRSVRKLDLQAEAGHPEKSGETSIFSFLSHNPALLVFSAILLIYNFCYIQWSFLLPLQTVGVFGTNGAGIYSLLVSINAVTVIVLTPLLTSLTHKVQPLRSIFVGGILYACSFALFVINRFIVVFIISVIVMTVGEILVTININSYIAQSTPMSFIGRANSLLTAVNGVGYAIGPVIIGYVLMLLNFQETWLAVSVLMLCGAGLMYFISKAHKASAQGSDQAPERSGDIQI